MKAFKKFLYMVTAVAAFLATGCTEQIEPEPAPELIGQQVYFDKNQNTAWVIGRSEDIKTEGGKSYVEIPVYRLTDADAYTVEYRFEAVDGIDAPTAPKFAAGEKATKFVVYFDEATFELGETKTFTIQLSQNQSEYGDSEYTFAINMPEPWVAMGAGVYVDDFLSPLLETPAGLMAEVEFEKHAENPNRIRVVEPFGAEAMFQMIGGVPGYFIYGEEPSYLEFDITDPTYVKLAENPSLVGFQINFSDVGALDALLYMFDNDEDGVYDAPITLVDGVIRFPANGLALGYLLDGSIKGWRANTTGMMAYALPGTELSDYTLAASYAGMKVSADNATTWAIIDFVMGADVERFRFAVVNGDVTANYADVVAGIVDNTLEGVIDAEAEETTWEVELTAGLYTLVAVPYGADGAVDSNAIAYSFYFNGLGELPEADVTVELGVVSELTGNPDHEQSYPAEYWIGAKITADASELEAINLMTLDPAQLEAYYAAGYDDAFLMENLGKDASSWIDSIAERGYTVGLFNVCGNSSLAVVFEFVTIYGTSQFVKEVYTVPAWSGTYPVGAYSLTEGDKSNVFSILPGSFPGDLVFVIDDVDGSKWHATLDETAKTLTCDGTEFGYEDYGNQFGALYAYFDQSQGQVYAYYSSTTADFAVPNEPLVINLNDDLTPKSLATYFAMVVVDYATGEMLGTYFNFSPAAVFAPFEASAQKASVVYADAFESMKQPVVKVETVEVEKQILNVNARISDYVREINMSSVSTSNAVRF